MCVSVCVCVCVTVQYVCECVGVTVQYVCDCVGATGAAPSPVSVYVSGPGGSSNSADLRSSHLSRL